MHIGIIGVGVVGNAVKCYYEREHTVSTYDKFKSSGSLQKACDADVIFICLPTPTVNGRQDIAPFEDILAAIPKGNHVVIKSTVLPGTTSHLQSMFPDLYLFHNPEFLNARSAVEDFACPEIQIVGTTVRSQSESARILQLLPQCTSARICGSSESEMVKYFLNLFMAVKNSFANQMYDYCQAKNINYEVVKDITMLSPRMGGGVHLSIYQDGYRGFLGQCLPKDLKALLGDCISSPVRLLLLELVDELNKKYTEEKQTTNATRQC